MLRIKPGVKVGGLKPEILLAVMVANDVYTEMGKDCWITSALDGKHKQGSKHYAGLAVDLRTRVFGTDRAMEECVATIQTRLNGHPDNFHGEYDVVLEATHIHMEFDPK